MQLNLLGIECEQARVDMYGDVVAVAMATPINVQFHLVGASANW